jgi:hypothetical protein
MLLFFFINLISFLLILKISYLFFNQDMYYPFRKAELNAFIIHNVLALIIMIYLFDTKTILTILLLNCLIFWSIYHISNMIQTSPRTKILLDLYNYKKIKKTEYLNIYTVENILDNRLKRFVSSNQIEINNNIVKHKSKKSILLILVFYIFKLLKSF